MTSHGWSEKDFDWESLSKAIYFIMSFWLKLGRIGSHGKEKWGTFRDHPYFWNGGIWGLIRPGYAYIGGPFLSFVYWKVDPIVKFITKYTGIYYLGLKYQAFIYNLAIQKMCKKYPHITDELCSDLDRPELIKPGLFGKVDGMEIHNKYWKTYEK